MARIKTVFTPDMVAHNFAHQTQTESRTAGRGTLFFDHDRIYSYGRHFCIARFVTNEKGERVLLFTTNGYSVSTAKHIRIVSHATNHINKIYCNDSDQGTSNLKSFEYEMKNALNGLATARKPEKYINTAEYALDKAVKYCAFFGIEVPAHLFELLSDAKNGKYSEYLLKERARIEKEMAEAEARALIAHKVAIKKWRAGETARIYSRTDDRDYLRINEKGNKIETSQGVEIPLEVAKRAWKWISAMGTCNGDCKFKILDFEVKEVTKTYIKIGCHTIDIAEIKKMAKKLSL